LPDLAGRLRAETRALHRQAEGSAFMARLLGGTVDQPGYCLLLRNLHAIYQALETAAAHLPGPSAVAQLFDAHLLRLPALEADLHFLHGPAWAAELPVLPAAAVYARRLDDFGPQQGHLLAAHAYVRYLGDLAGGQQLRVIVARSLHLQGAEGTAFYAFGAAAQVQRLLQAFRSSLNRCAVDEAQARDIVAEAQLAFEWHIALFAELDAA
jgi:heme oxygenase